MDSGNSGSLQSSSGGDEEYDSRATSAESVSAFMTGGQNSSNLPPPFFDPLSNYLHLHPNPNPLLTSWPRISTAITPPLRSDPNPISHDHDIINSNILHNSSPFMPSFQPPPNPAVAQPPPPQAAAPNPKKRSRASRRAPTTVLTTDTTNFRAMVQEFTGIPNPPFDNSVFSRTRFGSRSATLDPFQPPPYLRRPFPQKFQVPSNIPSTTTSTSLFINYQQQQLPPTQSSPNFLNNPLLTSLLQTNPKFTSVMTSKPLQGSFDITKNIGGLDHQLFVTDQTIASHHAGLFGSDHQKQCNSSNSEVNLTEFAPNLATENVAKRGEGMMESWICSSD